MWFGPVSKTQTTYTTTGFLAFDIVHAVEFSRIGCSWFSPFPTATQGLTCSFCGLRYSLRQLV
jgi:hypothetical protein